MGNSTTTLQAVVDSVSTIGDLRPVLTSTGGFAAEPAITIANDVAMEMFSERFPWKWNRIKLPPFILIPRQQDYCSLLERRIGWLENGSRILLNTTQFPAPTWPIDVVRDLPISRVGAGWPTRCCWFPNNQLEQFDWPGPNKVYTNPVGQNSTPQNYPINILDAKGNILVLTQWGTTGTVAPVAPNWSATGPDDEQPDDWPVGQVIVDGTVEWTVADPYAQGIRMWPPPPDSGGQSWLIRLFAQAKAPIFHTLQDKLDPIPDDQMKWFRDGFVAYAHRHSDTPAVMKRYPLMKQEWLAAMAASTKQADREDESKGFYPATGIMSPEYYTDPGPGNPYWRQWGGS